MPAGYPAQKALRQRIERARLLELEEGVREPVVYGGASERALRRQERAVALHDGGGCGLSDGGEGGVGLR